MKLSVIILNYNVSAFLELCLRSVEQAIQNIDAEIIVVDNDSSDGSCGMVKAKFPNVILIENKTNFGFPKGNNIGVAQAKGEYVCILNPDTVVGESTFTEVLSVAQSKSDLGALGVRLIDGKGNFLPESKRGVPKPWVAFTKISGLYKLFPKNKWFDSYYASHISETDSGEVPILVGAFMLLKKENYLAVGGFDEDCFMYSDDIDLSYLLLQKGLKNYYYGGTTVIHFKGESTVRDSKYMKRFQEAMNFFYKKHFKVSFFFNLLMQIGIYLFSFSKKIQGKTIVNAKIGVRVLYSDQIDLKQQLETISKNNWFMVSSFEELKKTVSQHTTQNVEIIFDNHFVNFKNIIETIVNCRSKLIYYRILPAKAEFYLGSDSSDSRGEVVYLKNVPLPNK